MNQAGAYHISSPQTSMTLGLAQQATTPIVLRKRPLHTIAL